MIELHNTIMGRRLIEHDIPEIHTQLKRIGNILENKQNNPFIDVLELIDFLEQLEATTKDKETANKIENYLIKKGIWTKIIPNTEE